MEIAIKVLQELEAEIKTLFDETDEDNVSEQIGLIKAHTKVKERRTLLEQKVKG